jgi:ORF6N domain
MASCTPQRSHELLKHWGLDYRLPRTAASWQAFQCVLVPLLAESERPICLIASICAEDGSTRTHYSCVMASTRSVTVDTDAIMRNILVIRGQRVLLDSDIAALYQVATKALTRAVRRNPGRFPPDFMFQLAAEESASLRSQSGALKTGRGKHRKYAPYVFTEQGIAMLSSVLTSERAVQVNIEIMRAFIRLRQAVSTHQDLAHKLLALENKYDRQFKVVFDAIRSLMKEPEPKRRGIGFTAKINE